MMRSVESSSSVFYQSQDDDALKAGSDFQGSNREATLEDSRQDSVTESPVVTEQDPLGKRVHASYHSFTRRL